MTTEIWKDIPGYTGMYQISSLGRMKSLQRKVEHSASRVLTLKEKILKPGWKKDGFNPSYILSSYGITEAHVVEIWIAKAWEIKIPRGYVFPKQKAYQLPTLETLKSVPRALTFVYSAKLTESQKKSVKILRLSGMDVNTIAEVLSINPSTVSKQCRTKQPPAAHC